MENISASSGGFKTMKCTCGYFKTSGKNKLYRMPNQFGICEVHEPLAMFFKNVPAEEQGTRAVQTDITAFSSKS